MSSVRKVLVLLMALGLVVGLVSQATAGPSAEQELQELKQQVQALNSRIQQIEGQVQDQDVSPALEKRVRELEARMTERAADQPPFSAGWKDGFTIQSGDGQHVLHIAGYLQADGVWQAGDTGYREESTDRFDAHRIRMLMYGTVYKYFDFEFEYSWDRGSAGLRDAYVDITYFDPVNLQVGFYKPPISHEDLMDSSNLHLMERSLMNNLVPDRDTGLMLHGLALNEILLYQLAMMNGQDVGAVDGDDEIDYLVRVMITPMAATDNKWMNKLSFGGNFSWGNRESTPMQGGPALQPTETTYVTSSGLPFFTWAPGATLHEDLMRYGAELVWYAGPLHLAAEWMRLEQAVGTPALSPKRFQAEAYYVQVGWVITGEDARIDGIRPANDFDPRAGKWGAFELVLRYANFNIEDEAIHEGYASGTDTADAYTVGVNWYLNPAVRVMLNYEHVSLVMDRQTPQGNTAEDDDSIMFRVQLKF